MPSVDMSFANPGDHRQASVLIGLAISNCVCTQNPEIQNSESIRLFGKRLKKFLLS